MMKWQLVRMIKWRNVRMKWHCENDEVAECEDDEVAECENEVADCEDDEVVSGLSPDWPPNRSCKDTPSITRYATAILAARILGYLRIYLCT